VIRISPKSGRPVFGQTDVNSGQRIASGDEVFENDVDDVLVEDLHVAKRIDVKLQTLQLDTALVRHVGDADFTEVRQARLRADRRELRVADGDLVIAAGLGVGESLERHLQKSVAFMRVLIGYLPVF